MPSKKLKKAIWLLCLIWACGCTSESSVSKQDSQKLKGASRSGYVQVDKRWLTTLETDCRAPRQPQDDPEYPGSLPDHVEVSAAYYGKVLKACDQAGGQRTP